MERVRLYPDAEGAPSAAGVGQYAAALMKARPLLPVEEEGRLHDPVLRENFIERVYTYHRWQRLIEDGLTAGRLVEFHTAHKFAILAHGPEIYRQLGRLVASAGQRPLDDLAHEYIALLMQGLKKRASRRGHANVLQHVQGYLKTKLDADDKAELGEVIDRYRRGQLPLVVPVTLLRHHFRKHPSPYIDKQIYLNPHPPELMLRNLI